MLPVRDAGELRRFLDVPYQLHMDEPRWLPPLRSDLHARLRFRRNPFWKRADGALFLARRGGRQVGRISVHMDSAIGATRDSALFGWFESEPDSNVVEALLGAATKWARDEGVRALVGPASFTAYDGDVGVLVDGYDQPASHLSPWHPPEYAALLESYGLEPASDLAVARLSADPGGAATPPPPARAVERAVLAHAGELDLPFRGHPAAWLPTVPELRHLLGRVRPLTERSLGVAGEGGVALAVRDLAPVLALLKGRLGLKGTARVLSEARRRREGAAVALLATDDAPQTLSHLVAAAGAGGYGHIEITAADTAADVHGAVAALGGTVVRRYRTYRMSL